jgi:hypothetical protein
MIRTLSNLAIRASASLVLAASVASTGGVALAGTHAHEPSHDGQAHAALALDHGRKWATDARLREGMDRIRAIVASQWNAARAGRMTPAQYAALGRRIETEVGGIVADCDLEPEADAMLHVVLERMVSGVDAMVGDADGRHRAQGFVRVAHSLDDYGRHFDHPGFGPVPASR